MVSLMPPNKILSWSTADLPNTGVNSWSAPIQIPVPMPIQPMQSATAPTSMTIPTMSFPVPTESSSMIVNNNNNINPPKFVYDAPILDMDMFAQTQPQPQQIQIPYQQSLQERSMGPGIDMIGQDSHPVPVDRHTILQNGKKSYSTDCASYSQPTYKSEYDPDYAPSRRSPRHLDRASHSLNERDVYHGQNTLFRDPHSAAARRGKEMT